MQDGVVALLPEELFLELGGDRVALAFNINGLLPLLLVLAL